MKMIIAFLTILLWLAGPVSSAQEKNPKKVIFEFKDYPTQLNVDLVNYTPEMFFKTMGITFEDNPVSQLFSPKTELNNRVIPYDHPLEGTAFLLKKILPQKGQFQLYLFTYWNTGYSNEFHIKLPTIELQVFDKNQNLVDKIIVVDGALSECEWKRRFTLYSDFTFETIDRDSCWQLDGSQFDAEEQVIQYHIDETGDIKVNRVTTRFDSGAVN